MDAGQLQAGHLQKLKVPHLCLPRWCLSFHLSFKPLASQHLANMNPFPSSECKRNNSEKCFPALTTLPFCLSTAFHHEQLFQGLFLKQNHVGITWLLSVWMLLRVFLLAARELSSVVLPSFIIRCLIILVIWKHRSAGLVCKLGTQCLVVCKDDFSVWGTRDLAV